MISIKYIQKPHIIKILINKYRGDSMKYIVVQDCFRKGTAPSYIYRLYSLS